MKLSDIVFEGVHDPAIFKVVFVVGGPGSGKSYIVDKLGLHALGFKSLNSDEALTYLMQKGGLSLKMPPEELEKRELVRGRAKELTQQKENLLLDGRLGVVVDGTGEDVNKIVALYEKFKTIGYEPFLVFVNATLDTARARNQQRARTVPDEILEKKWHGAQRNLGTFLRMFRNHAVIDNDGEAKQTQSQIDDTYLMLKKFAEAPVNNKIAKDWINSQLNKSQVSEHSKYLGATEKVANISPVLKGSYGKKQKKLMNKFFGSS